ISRFSKMSTLNIRVDYLRPGSGKKFRCISYVIRAGNKIAVTRMDMFNDSDNLIATGTGTYLIG
ncbi:MAG TPA: hotdog domain-containing protein, partial [Spirochaetota bacterium]|nr:hotdog domain-containing protein [Spirochaetota bacterium]